MGLPESAPFAISVRNGDGAVVFDLDEDFDMNEVETFRCCIDAVLASSNGGVVVDVADVTFMDSCAIQALLFARECLADQGREFVLRHFTGPAARILELAGLANVLVDSADDEIQPAAD
jgi:anti-anti-sigma factor